MTAPRKYTAKSLERATRKYFASISRKVPLTERVDTGEKDGYGHAIYEDRPVLNQLGEQVELLEYLSPPTVSDLCAHLRIHRSTWDEWCNAEKRPDLADVTAEVKERIRAHRDRELLTRRDVKGVIFDLQVNHGCRAKTEIELGPRGAAAVSASSIPVSERSALLRELMEEFSREDAEESGQ